MAIEHCNKKIMTGLHVGRGRLNRLLLRPRLRPPWPHPSSLSCSSPSILAVCRSLRSVATTSQAPLLHPRLCHHHPYSIQYKTRPRPIQNKHNNVSTKSTKSIKSTRTTNPARRTTNQSSKKLKKKRSQYVECRAFLWLSSLFGR